MSDDYFDADFELPERPKQVCSSCHKLDQVTETFIDGEDQNRILCYDCCDKEGFCFGCGDFSGGEPEFEFSEIGAYCENCQDQIKADTGYDEEDEDDF